MPPADETGPAAPDAKPPKKGAAQAVPAPIAVGDIVQLNGAQVEVLGTRKTAEGLTLMVGPDRWVDGTDAVLVQE